jgi:hypothetical protein
LKKIVLPSKINYKEKKKYTDSALTRLAAEMS